MALGTTNWLEGYHPDVETGQATIKMTDTTEAFAETNFAHWETMIATAEAKISPDLTRQDREQIYQAHDRLLMQVGHQPPEVVFGGSLAIRLVEEARAASELSRIWQP